MPRLPITLVSDLTPGQQVRGWVHSCETCGTLFIGSLDARFCCDACRVKFARSK